jgi:putative ABC transport system ATP-binding protein
MIELQQVTKVFNPGKANKVLSLAGISLEIKKQQFVVVVGANGSGKTTLLNIISGAEFATEGKILLDGKDISRLPEHRRSRWIARVFQDPLKGTSAELSILENFRLAAIRTTSKKLLIGLNEVFKKRVQERISVLGMGLENKLELPMGSLSGGQRQALTLLMSVMDETQILLLDEPCAALDPRSAALILQIAGNIIEQYKLTALLITHNLKEAHSYGNRIIQLGEGKIMRDLKGEEKTALTLEGMYSWFN